METFSALLALCAGNSPVPVNSPHKGQWRGALMFSLICARINDWVNNREVGDLRRHHGHYDVNVMSTVFCRRWCVLKALSVPVHVGLNCCVLKAPCFHVESTLLFTICSVCHCWRWRYHFLKVVIHLCYKTPNVRFKVAGLGNQLWEPNVSGTATHGWKLPFHFRY